MAKSQMYQDFKAYDREWKKTHKEGAKGARPMGIRNVPPPVQRPTNATPVQLEGPAPVQLEDTAPVQLEDAAPVQLEDAAPVQLEDAAPVLQAHGRRKIPKCICITIAIAIAIAIATIILCVSMPARKYEHEVSQNLPAPGEHPPGSTEHALDVRLDPGVDISGLQCIAARLSPLDVTVSGSSQNHELLPNVTDKLKALSYAEHQLVSRLLEVRTQVAEMGQRLEEIHAASDNPKLGFLARISALRRLRALMTRITEVRERVMDLQAEVLQQTDKFMPAMRAMVEELCNSVEENTLTEVYAEIWGGPGRIDLAGGAQHTLLFRGFCASAKSTHAIRYGQDQPLPADKLASELRLQAANLDLDAKIDLRKLHSKCGALCKIAYYLYRPAGES